MIKKYRVIIVTLAIAVSVISAADKKDTVNSNTPALTQQSEKSLAKQTNILPHKTSNWSKIKDLFM
jgi:hypothetical protein